VPSDIGVYLAKGKARAIGKWPPTQAGNNLRTAAIVAAVLNYFAGGQGMVLNPAGDLLVTQKKSPRPHISLRL